MSKPLHKSQSQEAEEPIDIEQEIQESLEETRKFWENNHVPQEKVEFWVKFDEKFLRRLYKEELEQLQAQ